MLIPLGSPDVQSKLQGSFLASIRSGNEKDIERVAQEVARHGGKNAGIVIRFNQHNPLRETVRSLFEARGVENCLVIG